MSAAPSLQPTNFSTLLYRFNVAYKVVEACTPDLLLLAKKLRHQVYCIDNNFEPSIGGVESDEFDEHSVHSLVIDCQSGQPIAAVRLILPPGLAMRRVLTGAARRRLDLLPRMATAEISRFSIIRKPRIAMNSALVRLGLFQGLFNMSDRYGISHWCALMEPSLLRMMSAMAIRPQPIGPLIDFHGMRQPCIARIADLLVGIKQDRPSFYDVITY